MFNILRHSNTAERLDKILIILIHFLLEKILDGEREDEDGHKQIDGDDDFFQIKNMEAFESAVLDSGKGYIDLESLKRWEDEDMLDTIRHHRRRQW